MKTENIALPVAQNNNINNNQQTGSVLSDDAFYLIALVTLLKKVIRPASLQQFINPGNFVVFNDEIID